MECHQVVSVLARVLSRRVIADLANCKFIINLNGKLAHEEEVRLRMTLVTSIILSARHDREGIRAWFTQPCPFLEGHEIPVKALQEDRFREVREAAHASLAGR